MALYHLLQPTTIAFSILILTTIFIIFSWKSKQRRRLNLPPSPPSLPFIGHLHLLKQPLHRTLQTLSTKYGPIFSLTLGVRNVLVVSSPSLVEECLNKNDVVFANRPHSFLGWKILGYNYTAIGSAPYGPHWRNLRRLSTVELLSTARLNSSLHVRHDEVNRLVSGLAEEVGWSGRFGRKVEMKSRLVGLSMNIVMRMVAGKRYFGGGEGKKEGREEGERFKELIREVFELSGTSNPVDFLPVLKWVDFSGLEKRMWRAHEEMDAFFQGLIDEHRRERREDDDVASMTTRKTMIDTMLSLQESEPETYSNDIIKGQVMSLILAGTDTSTATVEWAMSLLLNHPEILDKARAEIDNVIGNSRLVHEDDYTNLPYLQGIINEALRLYPVGPLLIPHQSSEECTIGGYSIAKETMLFVNAWTIHRDPTIWEDPTRFWPERHLEAELDSYKLLPFGVGRRSCPGSGLANRVVSVTLGALIQCFEWERVGVALLDMTEGPGLTMPKLEPMQAFCKPRELMKDVFNTIQGGI
ncbi:unnamed protein product [Linum tenue]|uniref:Cytochrome P450 n=1 Tax=Linum tenue TaxID=586396 RepID=A0AAV0P3H5_9ROSI|nr:unnamed protein product [Linum tenue]